VSALDQQDVLRLDVTVHDAFHDARVRALRGSLARRDRIGEAEKALLREEASEIFRSSAKVGPHDFAALALAPDRVAVRAFVRRGGTDPRAACLETKKVTNTSPLDILYATGGRNIPSYYHYFRVGERK